MTVVARRSGAAAMSSRDGEARLPVRHAHEDRVRGRGDVGNALRLARARRQAISRTGRVEAQDLVTGSGDARGHGPAHVPQPDEAEHRRRPSRCHGAGSGVMPSASSTWRASLKASTPAGTPA